MTNAVPGIGRRFASMLYESLVVFAVLLIGFLLPQILLSGFGLVMAGRLLWLHVLLLLMVYFVWFWLNGGQTLPMKTWNIRLVDSKGDAVTQGRALGRYALSWLWFLPPLAAVAPFRLSAPEIFVIMAGWIAVWALLSRFHPQRQFWHDAWAGTRLVTSLPLSR